METTPKGADALGRVRDALLDAVRRGHQLAEATEQLEKVYENKKGPIDPGCFDVPSTAQTGRELEAEWSDQAPHPERRPRRKAIDAVLLLRAAVDAAIEAVSGTTEYMDGPQVSADQRWTTRTIGELRILRGAILRGHQVRDIFPSALPMIRAGVPQALLDASNAVAGRMEEVKSAILVGVQPHAAPPTIDPALSARLEAAAASDPGAIERLAERAVAKAVEAMNARDDDDAPALPAVTDAIDEHDAAILAFLNRAPSLRRKVSDVLPEEGPQDRKAVAARLRKLADRTLPLVDYPKGGRGGVAILTAGVEALKRATPPTPR